MIYYVQFSILDQVQLEEVTELGPLPQEPFSWGELRAEPGKRADSPSFPAFCLFKLLVFEYQLSSLCKDISI